MGQAQRSRTRDSISVISGSSSRSRTGNSAQRRRGGGGERVRQRSKNSGGLENLELWEISRQPGSSRMMRLADQEQVRYGQRRACANLRTQRRGEDNPRPISSARRRKARKRRLNLYRLSVFCHWSVPDFDLSDNGGGLPHDARYKRGKRQGHRGGCFRKNRGEPHPAAADYRGLSGTKRFFQARYGAEKD